MQIRIASDENQLARIERLANQIWREHFTPIIGRAQVDYMLEKFQSVRAITEQIENGYRYFLLEEAGRDIGYMGTLLQADHLFLSKLYVLSAQRCRGRGRQAVAYLDRLAADSGAERIWLTVNRHNYGAITAYEKLGFRKTGKVVQDIGGGFVMDDYRMERVVGTAKIR